MSDVGQALQNVWGQAAAGRLLSQAAVQFAVLRKVRALPENIRKVAATQRDIARRLDRLEVHRANARIRARAQ